MADVIGVSINGGRSADELGEYQSEPSKVEAALEDVPLEGQIGRCYACRDEVQRIRYEDYGRETHHLASIRNRHSVPLPQCKYTEVGSCAMTRVGNWVIGKLGDWVMAVSAGTVDALIRLFSDYANLGSEVCV